MGNSDSCCKSCRNCTSSHSKTDEKCTCFCQDAVTCTCKCNVNNGHNIAQKASAIAGGTIVGAGGIALTVFTGGVALPIIGGMVAGAGISSLIHGAVKAAKREKISGKDFAVDVGVGFATGFIGGGGTAATNSLANVAVNNVAKEAFKRGAIKLSVRTAGGVVSSIATTAVTEAGNCAKGNKNWSEYGNDPNIWGKGILFGAVTGAGNHAFSNVSKLGSISKNTGTQLAKENVDQSRKNSISSEILLNIKSKEKQLEYMRGLGLRAASEMPSFLRKMNEESDLHMKMETDEFDDLFIS